jgi:hypothetical protein
VDAPEFVKRAAASLAADQLELPQAPILLPRKRGASGRRKRQLDVEASVPTRSYAQV